MPLVECGRRNNPDGTDYGAWMDTAISFNQAADPNFDVPSSPGLTPLLYFTFINPFFSPLSMSTPRAVHVLLRLHPQVVEQPVCPALRQQVGPPPGSRNRGRALPSPVFLDPPSPCLGCTPQHLSRGLGRT